MSTPHVLLALHAGDYLDAARRRAQGEADRYRHHSYAIDSLMAVRDEGAFVTVVQMFSPETYDEVHDGLRFVGLAFGQQTGGPDRLADMVRREGVTHVMLRSPSVPVLDRLESLPVRVGVVLADSFPSRLRHRKRYGRLGRAMARPQVDFVANHHLASSRQLVRVLGIAPERVVPWDWPLDLLDQARVNAKTRLGGGPVTLCYVGSIEPSKGVFDLVRALALLGSRGVDARVEIAGAGRVEEMWQLADRLGVRARLTHHGRVGGDDVFNLMRRSTFVCVPSRRSYPEGLPLTIYEAMASGTPMVASNHPMFRGVVREGETGFVFRAGHPRSLARAVERGLRPEAYAFVSATAAAAYPELGLKTLWGDVLVHWLGDADDGFGWLRERSLGACVIDRD